MPSLGLTGAAIPGTKYGVRRLVNGLARDLFLEDSAIYYQDLLGYRVPELESLESAVTWFDRFLADTINPQKLIDQLGPAALTKPLRDKRAVVHARPKRTVERAHTNKRTKRKAGRRRAKYRSNE
jgi:FAD-dependent urate hydroxylase